MTTAVRESYLTPVRREPSSPAGEVVYIRPLGPLVVGLNGRVKLPYTGTDPVRIGHNAPLTVERLDDNSLKVYGTETNPQLEALANPEKVGERVKYDDPNWVEIGGQIFRHVDYVRISGPCVWSKSP